MQALRRVVQQGLSLPATRRAMGGGAGYVPKPDTSMDHVFGDSSFKLPFDFKRPPPARTAGLTVVVFGIFFAPLWIMFYEDYKMQSFLSKLEAAKAAKGA